jgi:uncharacterized protein (TIGR03663 family)
MAGTGTERRKPRFRERNTVRRSTTSAPPAVPKTPAPPPAAVAREVPRRRLQRAVPRLTVEQGLFMAIIVIAFALRIWDVGARAMHGDESVHAWFAWQLFTGQGYQYDPVYHGPLQFPITALFFFLFGDSETSGRLLAVLTGTALVGMPYFLRDYMGRLGALLASFFIAISPEFVYDSRLERDDALTVLFAMTLAVAIWRYVRTGRSRYVYMGAASAALSLASMENTYITLFVFGSFILLVLFGERLAWAPVGGGLRRLYFRFSSTPALGWIEISVLAVALILALIVTVATGLYPPVPAVLALGLAALVIRQSVLQSGPADGARFTDRLREISGVQWLNAGVIIIAILFAFYSTFGTNLRGIWDSTQPMLNTNGACPGNPFILNPCRKDIVGGLFYWLSQHRVARGGQPWFYYSFLFSLYEQLALIFGVGGILYFLRRTTLFTTFLTYWAVLMFGIYSWAGEKFPWLLVHPLLPFTLLAAMFSAEMLARAGISRLVMLIVVALLALVEIHSMYEVNFVNGADPVEMMVYVQSAPDTPRVAHTIETLSNKVTNGNSMNVTIDTNETWPFAWYLRHMTHVAYPAYPQILNKPFSTNPVIIVDETNNAAMLPKLGNRYTGHEYVLRWWFPEDYKTLTWTSFGRDLVNPGYWKVVWDWLTVRRPFGPKGTLNFYLYIKKGLASPF